MYPSSLSLDALFVSCGSSIAVNGTALSVSDFAGNVTVRRVVRQLLAGPFGIHWKWKVCRYVAFIKFCPLQRLSFGERDRRSRLNSSRRWSVISPSLHGSPMVVCSFWMDGFAVLTSWNI